MNRLSSDSHDTRPRHTPEAHPTLSRVSIRGLHWSYHVVRIGLGAVFVFSGCIKLLNPDQFSILIHAYGLIPDGAVFPAAIGLSMLEVAAGIGLLIDVQWSLTTIVALLIFFMIILGYGLWLGLDVECGCFGPDDPEGQAYHSLRPALYRDLLMLMGTGFLFWWRRNAGVHPVLLTTICNRLMNGGKKR